MQCKTSAFLLLLHDSKSLALNISTNKIHDMLCNISSLQHCQTIYDRLCKESNHESFQQQNSDYAI